MTEMTSNLNTSIGRSLPISAAQIIDIDNGVYTMPSSRKSIEIISGTAWLTMDNRDIVLRPGDTFEITSSTNPTLISSTNNQPLRFMMK